MNASEFQSSRKFVQTAFGRIAYVERGNGPVALFAHALPLCGYQWRYALDEVSSMRTCVAPDLMGLGYSEIPARQDISYESQARMLAALLDARSIRQVDLIGNDTGGGVSQIFLALYPERVRSLTLTNCEVHDLWPNAMLQQFYAALKAGLVGEALKNITRDPSSAAQLAATYENPESLTKEALEVYFGPFVDSEQRREQLKGFSEAERNRDQLVAAAKGLRTSQIPAQVLWGDADTAFDTSASIDWLNRNLGGLRKVTTIPRAKLFWPEEHPRLLTVLLKEFWSGLD
ncbi:alpha/beta fold hydrolase [Candidatus Binatus sp.]|uniref:alpha/beta fold hydrolase n=1 Tax=Candidatus Binatus sp. TaxID=2811406 RepID=UPI003CC69BE7